jgi:Mannose-6-phosphate isomerase
VNKLRGNKLVKHKWGNAVIWAHTDSYIAKTLEIPVNKRTSLVVHEQKEKSIIVIKGEVLLTYGSCCTETDVPVYKLPTGWSWYIQPGMIHRYEAFGKESAVIIEISSPEMEDGIMLVDEDNVVFAPPKDVMEELKNKTVIKEEKVENEERPTDHEETKGKTKKRPGRPRKTK